MIHVGVSKKGGWGRLAAMLGFGEVLICAGVVVVLVLGGAVAFIAFRKANPPRPPAPPGQGPPVPAPTSRSVTFFLRFEGREDEQYVRDLAQRHGALRSATEAREAALDVVRAAPTATHVWAGPASEAPHGPGVARSGLPGGVVLGFQVHATTPMDTVADDQDLGAVVARLRQIAAWTDPQFAGAELRLAQASVDAQAPPLVAVRKDSRPGHQLCAYCGQAFLAHDTRCPNCGARASR